jgi:hypothetical protein
MIGGLYRNCPMWDSRASSGIAKDLQRFQKVLLPERSPAIACKHCVMTHNQRRQAAPLVGLWSISILAIDAYTDQEEAQSSYHNYVYLVSMIDVIQVY